MIESRNNPRYRVKMLREQGGAAPSHLLPISFPGLGLQARVVRRALRPALPPQAMGGISGSLSKPLESPRITFIFAELQ